MSREDSMLASSMASFHSRSSCSTTAAFTVIRGNKDTTGITGMIKPLAIVSVPTIAYAAYYRAAPPQALTFGLLSCVFLHTFDRMLRPRGLFEENMPTTKLNRRTF
jgi:hypothetical protein